MPQPTEPNTVKKKKPNEVPQSAEFGQLRAFLARAGMKNADITAAIGGTVKNRKRDHIGRELKGWMKERPKKK